MHRIDGAGHVDHMFVGEDPATNRPPTEFTPEWFNGVQEELAMLIEWAGLVLAKGDNTQLKQALLAKFATISDLNGKVGHYSSGSALPTQNVGPIWHDDYNSVMTWNVFNSNGANYTGYASVLVGGLLIDTQPTPRAGYIKSGIANLSRTAYAALRGWAMHNGIMVAAGTWAAGAIAVKDNADGTTFTAFDVRGEFPRFWDDARGIDSGRVFGSAQLDALQGHFHNAYYKAATTVGTGGNTYAEHVTSGNTLGPITDMIRDAITDGTSGTPRIASETRSRNTALLASVKF